MNARQKRKAERRRLGKLKNRLHNAKQGRNYSAINGIKTQIAAQMRKLPTKGEKHLWNAIAPLAAENSWLIEKQVFINPYIADFVINGRIIIECDGPFHRKRYDERRDQFLLAKGYRTLRLKNEEISNDISGCLTKIKAFI